MPYSFWYESFRASFSIIMNVSYVQCVIFYGASLLIWWIVMYLSGIWLNEYFCWVSTTKTLEISMKCRLFIIGDLEVNTDILKSNLQL